MKNVRLDSVCEIIAGQSPPSDTYNQDKDGVPFFQGKADFGSLYPTVRYWCSVPKKISIPEDILFSVRAPVGPTNINNIEACIGRGLSALRCKKDVLVLKYLLHFLRANETKIADLGTGSTFKAITISELKKLQIPLPPLPQQQKIAAILDAADALRQNDKALIAKYDELTQALFLDMFGDPVSNPKEWEMQKLEMFCKFENGDRSSNYPSGDDIKSSGKLFLSSGDIKRGRFIVKDSKFISDDKYISLKRGKCYRNDVLMTLRGNGTGKSAIFDCEYEEGFINAQMVIIRPNEKCKSNYLVLQLNNPAVFKRLVSFNSGSAQPQLSARSVKEFKVFLPPVALQNQFADRVAAIEEQKVMAQKSLVKSEELFNSLLQKAFKGELV
jgi:type I restriction enzyme S subunit